MNTTPDPHATEADAALSRFGTAGYTADDAAELERLRRHLHVREMHPDYEYETTETARKSGESREPDGEGWEPNNRIPLGEGQWRNWDRFDWHEEEYWMRRKAVAQLHPPAREG